MRRRTLAIPVNTGIFCRALVFESKMVDVSESANHEPRGADSPVDAQRQDHPTPKPIFLAEVNYWAEKLGVQPTEVHVRAMKNKWGSSTATGRVSFSSELLWQVPNFRKQVILEELERLKARLSTEDDSPAA